MKADFSGYATKNGLKCSDGRTIMPDAFAHQDNTRVPLVWQHGHSDPNNVLGHALLENRPDGVYAHAFFNTTDKGVVAKSLVQHGDVTSLSIYANQLVERNGNVTHGAIRELSLVLSGANPGAKIDFVAISHSDGDITEIDEAVIYTGLSLMHEDDETSGLTVQEVYDSMTEDQQTILHYMVGEALAAQAASHSDETDDETNTAEHSGMPTEGTTNMTKNVFEQGTPASAHLSHAAFSTIIADAAKSGSLKTAVEDYALAHSITDIETLFPDAKLLNNPPEWVKRNTSWVAGFMSAAVKSPFSRIKTRTADLTYDTARAKGYIKGNLKKEQFFALRERMTTPTTVYKKQGLDRDDLIDITDFDVVAWLKSEMRFMLEEEIARAALVGDGRASDDVDKIRDGSINNAGIRPIATDDEFYTTTITVNVDDSASSMNEVVDAIIRNRAELKGTGQPNLYTTEAWIAKWLTMRDTLGHRIYKTLDELASELRVSAIIPVEVLDQDQTIIGILVNPTDYVFGADKGGEVTMFDDFDIDYNKMKYLIETRVCGALVKPKAAMVVRATEAVNILVKPVKPSFVNATGVLTITNQTGVVYKNGATVVNAAGSPYAAIAAGASITITATPAAGYYFESSEDDTWVFTRNA